MDIFPTKLVCYLFFLIVEWQRTRHNCYCLQILAEAINLVEHKVDVGFGDRDRRNDRAEKVGTPIVRLVAHHQRAGLHHPGLYDRADLAQLRLLLGVVRNAPQPLRDVPEGHVHALRLQDQVELVRLLPDALHLVLSQLHQVVHVAGETVRALGTPLQPQLEDVVVAATLDDLVAGVVADVVQLVRHEQILGGHLVTADQKTLQSKEGTNVGYSHSQTF